ncbi:hypothetical protein B4N89_46230 [Embleya scabrispora]|uniref:Uncharacterized protein n=1 Tax=Embleya scabrispora TaxID=159449 RepID=A0A1T3NJ71_9ACTN|nr:hypothetical protein [Embleya scabrispora]OPC76873.1 hypothetical protein B4N89_46230 [Embleya scabrispora]
MIGLDTTNIVDYARRWPRPEDERAGGFFVYGGHHPITVALAHVAATIGMTEITEANVPEWSRRLACAAEIALPLRDGPDSAGRTFTVEEVEGHVGLVVNVAPMTADRFDRVHAIRLRKRDGLPTVECHEHRRAVVHAPEPTLLYVAVDMETGQERRRVEHYATGRMVAIDYGEDDGVEMPEGPWPGAEVMKERCYSTRRMSLWDFELVFSRARASEDRCAWPTTVENWAVPECGAHKNPDDAFCEPHAAARAALFPGLAG